MLRRFVISLIMFVLIAVALPHRSARVIQTQPGPGIPGNSYSEVLNTLFATSGR